MHLQARSVLVATTLLVGGNLGCDGTVQEAEKQLSANFETLNLVLYQPDPVLAVRLPADGAAALADYVKRLEAAANDALSGVSTSELLDIVIIVRPSSMSRVWFVSERSTDDAVLAQLRHQLESVEPLLVRAPVGFAISGSLGGAHSPVSTESYEPPMPPEWHSASEQLSGSVEIIDGLLPLVWPKEDSENLERP